MLLSAGHLTLFPRFFPILTQPTGRRKHQSTRIGFVSCRFMNMNGWILYAAHHIQKYINLKFMHLLNRLVSQLQLPPDRKFQLNYSMGNYSYCYTGSYAIFNVPELFLSPGSNVFVQCSSWHRLAVLCANEHDFAPKTANPVPKTMVAWVILIKVLFIAWTNPILGDYGTI